LPRDWLLRTRGQSRGQGPLLGARVALPGRRGPGCAAPVAAGRRNQQVSMGGALAVWRVNTLLNPAWLVFMGCGLGWQFALV
nr:permease [Klebsiella pneumoniae]